MHHRSRFSQRYDSTPKQPHKPGRAKGKPLPPYPLPPTTSISNPLQSRGWIVCLTAVSQEAASACSAASRWAGSSWEEGEGEDNQDAMVAVTSWHNSRGVASWHCRQHRASCGQQGCGRCDGPWPAEASLLAMYPGISRLQGCNTLVPGTNPAGDASRMRHATPPSAHACCCHQHKQDEGVSPGPPCPAGRWPPSRCTGACAAEVASWVAAAAWSAAQPPGCPPPDGSGATADPQHKLVRYKRLGST